MKFNKILLAALAALCFSTAASATMVTSGYVIETGYTANKFDSANKGPFGMDFKNFVSDGNEQYVRIGIEKYALEFGLEARTKEGKTQEGSFYGRMLMGSGSTRFFLGGHFGVGKDTGADGQNFTVLLKDMSGSTVAVDAKTTGAPKYTVAGAETGIIQDITDRLALVVKGEVQTKSYKLETTLNDPAVQGTLDPLSVLAVEEAKRFETEIMEWKAGISLRYQF